MATFDWTGTDIIPNGSGSAVRADLNDALLALFSQNSSGTAPLTTVAYMLWADSNEGYLKIRDSANPAIWYKLFKLDGQFDALKLLDGTAAAPSLYFTSSGTDTGVYSPGVDQVGITTAGVQRVNFNGSTEVVFNDGGADIDFRIEGDTEPNLFKIDAGTDQVQVANLNGGPLAGTRNRIINGDMRIDQRFGGAAAIYGAGFAYVLDRWSGGATIASNMRVQQVTDAPSGFTNSLKADAVTGATITASDYFSVLQSIEGFNVSDLGFGTASASSVTLSFWVKSSVTGTHSGSVRNSANDRSYPYTYTISSADTWEKKAIVIPGDTSGTWLTTNGVGIQVSFDLGTGSTFRGTAGAWASANYAGATGAVSPLATSGATWYVTGVQLETGSLATPFERRSYGQELSLCQRYYGTVTTQVTASATSPAKGVFYKTSMRAAATIIAGGGAGFAAINSTTEGFDCTQTSAASQTLTFSAEL
jgi:hypothetical protein